MTTQKNTSAKMEKSLSATSLVLELFPAWGVNIKPEKLRSHLAL